jgi:hypothetical protein
LKKNDLASAVRRDCRLAAPARDDGFVLEGTEIARIVANAQLWEGAVLIGQPPFETDRSTSFQISSTPMPALGGCAGLLGVHVCVK